MTMQTQEHLNPSFFQLALCLALFTGCAVVFLYGLVEIPTFIRSLIQDTMTDFELWIRDSQAFH